MKVVYQKPLLSYIDRVISSIELGSTTYHHLIISQKMTLDILHFIDNKGGNAEEIRDSQRKRGNSVELVDEVIQMYTEWVKSRLQFTQTDVITMLNFWCSSSGLRN